LNKRKAEITFTPIELKVLFDASMITQEFIREAIKEWDRFGEGHFADFVQDYVNSRWEGYVIGN